MIKISETDQYTIAPRELLAQAFSSSYSRYADGQEEVPPDTATMVCTNISMVILIAIFALTAMRYESERFVWFGMCALVVGVIVIVMVKYFKTRAAYLKAAGKPSRVKEKEEAFYALFGGKDAIEESMSAGELYDDVRVHLGKQNDEVLNNALRNISEDLVRKNNPELPACRQITPLKERFTQSRTRCYFRKDGGDYVIFDQNWNDPVGQISFEEDDIVSYGLFSQYPASINKSGGKIRADSGVIELAGEDGSVYFEFVGDEYEKALKLLPRRKEKK